MWDPFRDVERLLNRMQSVTGTSFLSTSARGSWVPAMDIVEREDSYKILADLPGMNRNDVSVEIEGSQLCIGGNRKSMLSEEEHKNVVMAERGSGRFERCVRLPSPLEEGSVKASLRDSVLLVEVKKVTDAVRKRSGISVKIN
ncbi:putative heat shock protein 20 [Trypanosoma cruzi]|uniref:Heat shock protein 20, putative n=3 Tax=Trypanosoma cruzi TaxID=5693 RepID=G3XCP0_TRYCC|eukprot:XP_810967.1 heat shock protein 20 [Trypanosoma cruzi strain CL Brener]